MSRLRLLYGLLDRVQGRGVLSRLDAALARDRLGPAALAAFSRSRLEALLADLLEGSPFHRARLLTVSDDPSVLAGDAFAGLPPLEKAEVADPRTLSSDEGRIRSAVTVTSGGTTGPPTRILIDRETLDAQTAATLRSFLWFGADPVGRNVMLWGPPPEENTYATLSGRLKGLLLGRTLLPTFGLDDAGARRYWERVSRRRLDWLAGYSSALVALAAAARPGETARIRSGVIAAAEPIFDFQRDLIEEAFGAPVSERYGSNEFALMAQQCPRGRRHVASDRVLIEIVDEQGRPRAAGETGEILVTDLDNRALPLVRYRIGDLGALGAPCDCGLPWPVLERVHGRASDRLVDREGALVSPHRLAESLRGTRARGFQVLVDPDRRPVAVHVEGAAIDLDEPLACWRDLLGAPGLDAAAVASLRRSASGKILPVVPTSP